jgi:hypothetical protein
VADTPRESLLFKKIEIASTAIETSAVAQVAVQLGRQTPSFWTRSVWSAYENGSHCTDDAHGVEAVRAARRLDQFIGLGGASPPLVSQKPCFSREARSLSRMSRTGQFGVRLVAH